MMTADSTGLRDRAEKARMAVIDCLIDYPIARDKETERFVSAVQQLVFIVEDLLASPAPAGAEGWRPIETAPDDGTALVLRSGGWITVGSWNKHRSRWVVSSSSYEAYPSDEQPTEWLCSVAVLAASPAPAQATPPAEARDLVERYARAICTARGHGPETLHQVVDPTDYADTSDSHGHRFIYGWRKWVAAAEAVLALPAAPEVRGQAAFSAAKNCRRKHGCFAPRHCNLVGECASSASAKTAEDR